MVGVALLIPSTSTLVMCLVHCVRASLQAHKYYLPVSYSRVYTSPGKPGIFMGSPEKFVFCPGICFCSQIVFFYNSKLY